MAVDCSRHRLVCVFLLVSVEVSCREENVLPLGPVELEGRLD